VPIQGDFVVIAVVAERGPTRTSRAPVGVGREEDGAGSDNEYADASRGGANTFSKQGAFASNTKGKGKQKGKGKEDAPRKPSGRKYISLKLVDFGARTASSATGGKKIIRGDALLSLLLFEADEMTTAVDDAGHKTKIYRGGSGGAFEKVATLREGAVIALLNPKILKPFQVRLFNFSLVSYQANAQV
jgi:minichromosome maintenance protein 10